MTSELQAELATVLGDTSWLDKCTCSDLPLDNFFVQAGRTMPAEAVRASRLCPTRRQEVMWAYGRDIRMGYFGGLSGGQRSSMSLEQALDFVARDTEKAHAEHR